MPPLQTPSDLPPADFYATDARVSWPKRMGLALLILATGAILFYMGHTGWRRYHAFSRDPIVHWLGLSHKIFAPERGFYEVSGVLLMLLSLMIFFKSSGRIMLPNPFASRTTPGTRSSIGLGFKLRRVQPGEVNQTTHFQTHTRTVREVRTIVPNRSGDTPDPSDPFDPPAPPSLR